MSSLRSHNLLWWDWDLNPSGQFPALVLWLLCTTSIHVSGVEKIKAASCILDSEPIKWCGSYLVKKTQIRIWYGEEIPKLRSMAHSWRSMVLHGGPHNSNTALPGDLLQVQIFRIKPSHESEIWDLVFVVYILRVSLVILVHSQVWESLI